ncbi:MAG: trigger factor [Clostridia bacterium]|nr:trigger factor [Clostridia bacterium]
MTSLLVTKENCQATFTMEFTAEEFDAATDRAFKKNRGQITVPGFRKGKAPRNIIENRYGTGVFFEEAIDDLLNEEYPKALDSLDIEPVGRPDIQFGEEKLEKGKGFKVTVKVETAPEVTVKDYKGMAVERKFHKVTDEDVQRQLEMLQRRNARQITVEDGAKLEDTVILDYKGFVGEEQFEGGTADNQSLKLGSGQFIPGFEDQLVGIKPGEERDVKVTFPEEYHAENLAGKEAIFKCLVHEIKREELPALDDEFAKDASEFDTLEELKADEKRKLEESSEKAKEYDGKNAVVEKLVELNPITLPQAMIENETDAMLEEYEQQMSYQGISLDMYCKYMDKTIEDLRNEMKPQAEGRVKSRLALKAVAAQENIEVTDAEIEAEQQKMADQYKMELAKVKEAFGPENIKLLKEDIKNTKAIELLYANAKFTDVEDKPKA